MLTTGSLSGGRATHGLVPLDARVGRAGRRRSLPMRHDVRQRSPKCLAVHLGRGVGSLYKETRAVGFAMAAARRPARRPTAALPAGGEHFILGL